MILEECAFGLRRQRPVTLHHAAPADDEFAFSARFRLRAAAIDHLARQVRAALADRKRHRACCVDRKRHLVPRADVGLGRTVQIAIAAARPVPASACAGASPERPRRRRAPAAGSSSRVRRAGRTARAGSGSKAPNTRPMIRSSAISAPAARDPCRYLRRSAPASRRASGRRGDRGSTGRSGRVRATRIDRPAAARTTSEHQSTKLVAFSCDSITPLGLPVEPDV